MTVPQFDKFLRNYLTVVLTLAVSPLAAQDRGGSGGAATVGAALGTLTGASLATVSSILPCARTYAGPGCVRTAGLVGGAAGLGAGLLLGAYDSQQVEEMAERMAVGFAVGAAAGLVLKQVILYSTWGDVAATGVIGAAVATDPEAAFIGLTAGTVTGLVLWQLRPETDLVDAAELSLVGLAAGAVGSLIYRSIDAAVQRDSQPLVVFPVKLAF